MPINQPLSPRQARDVLHLALLEELAAKLGTEHWSVKGGVNLRAYFGSVRYSEDIDLDVAPFKRQAVKKHLRETLKPGGRFARRLREYGIQELRIDEKEISKDSETGEEVWLEQQVLVISLCDRLLASLDGELENGQGNAHTGDGARDA